MLTPNERDEMQARAETATTNPARTSVRDILARVKRDNGAGLTTGEVLKLTQHVVELHKLILARRVGWTVDERNAMAEIFGGL